MRVILIKYGELSTKKGNRNFFINTLYNNVKNKLSSFDVSIKKDRDKMTIMFEDRDLDEIKNRIDKIFGIHNYQVAYVSKSLADDIINTVSLMLDGTSFKTFKVETKRSDKTFPIRSQDFNRKVGGFVLKNYDCHVDVHNPDILIKIEIRRDNTFIYCHTYKGSGGYPVGSQPKGLLMLSGGIDSPVSGYLALKRGVEVDCVYFEAIPHTSIEARNKVVSLCQKLSFYTNKINLHIVNFTPIQEEIYKNCRSDYVITIMRRMMYRIMDKMAHKYKALAIINGESIGQVASQTLTSMSVINEVTNMPVIRPVACLDKLEIIDLARKIDTYDISILPYEDCCTVFVPKHPVINPKLDVCINEENKFNYSEMLDKAVEDVNTIVVDENYGNNDFKDLL